MPAVHEAISNDTYASKSTITVTKPTGTVAGDVLLAGVFLLGVADQTPPTPPAGFTIAPGTWPLALLSGFFPHLWLYSKVAGGAEPSTYDFSLDGARTAQGFVARASGVNTSTPFDVTPSQNTGTGVTATWTGVTTATDGALIYAIEYDFADTTADTVVPTGSTPTFTERLDVTLTYVASGNLATAGATGSKTHATNSGVGSPWFTTLVALRPASAGSSYARTGAVIVGP